jgi:rRNA maturation RNase YbeY
MIRRKRAATPRARVWTIHLALESKKLRLSESYIKRVVRSVLMHVEDEIALPQVREISVMFINDAKMRDINFEFRKKDKATDVLSFPQFSPREISGKARSKDVGGTYLGDLVISTETTIEQAKEYGVSQKAELLRLIVHGVLHLCGYDHEKVPAKEAQRMRRRERAIIALLAESDASLLS